jgi:hypothetical protein
MYSASKMKIKGLSSSNQVAGEGILHWSLQDADGNMTYIELLGYHITNAKVHLLSPHILLKTIGGHALQNDKEIAIVEDSTKSYSTKSYLATDRRVGASRLAKRSRPSVQKRGRE